LDRRDEVIGGWIKLHSEGLHNLFTSPNVIKMIKSRRERWAGHVVFMDDGSAHRVLVEKPEGKMPQGRSGHGCEGDK
jgi:hypothetical protein